MKKLFTLLVLSTIGLVFTGCFNIFEDIKLNKNGTGHYAVKYDLGGLFTDPMMKGIMMEALKENADLNLNVEGGLEVDSVMYMKDNPEFASLKASDKMKESAKIHMVISEKKSEFFVNFEFDFNNVDEIATFFKNLSEGNGQQGMGGFESIFNGQGFTFKKKCLTRKSGEPSGEPAINDEEMEMVKMFMGSAMFKTTYYFPGKVKKCSIEGAEVSGKTVSVSKPILDIMENAKVVDGEIRFKNR